MRDVVTHDNRLVNVLSMAAIFCVLLFAFRSLMLPFLLLLTIEAAIWINMSIPYFTGTALSYVGYLIISTVQLGATVDYAILYANRYLRERRGMPAREAARVALGGVFRSVMVSAAVLSLSGFALWGTSSNGIVQALGFLLGRGTLLSLFMVSCFLPCLLLVCDRAVGATTLGAGFFKAGAAQAQAARGGTQMQTVLPPKEIGDEGENAKTTTDRRGADA
jgi:predicted RND superfamily exporter protein